MIKGELPWKVKAENDVFNKGMRHKTKEGSILNYLSTLDDKFITLYKYLRTI